MFFKHQIRMTIDLKFGEIAPSTLPTGSPFSKTIHPCQYKFVFRQLYFSTYPAKEDDRRPKMREVVNKTIHQLAFRKLNKKHYNDNRHQLGTNVMASRIIEGFYHQGRALSWWPVAFVSRDKIDRNQLTDLLYGAMGPARMPVEWRSSDVMGLLRGIRQDENFDQLSLVADALEESGCGDTRLLDHLRSDAHKSLGDWIFKASGLIG